MKKQLFLYAIGLVMVLFMTAPIGFASHSRAKKSIEMSKQVSVKKIPATQSLRGSVN